MPYPLSHTATSNAHDVAEEAAGWRVGGSGKQHVVQSLAHAQSSHARAKRPPQVSLPCAHLSSGYCQCQCWCRQQGTKCRQHRARPLRTCQSRTACTRQPQRPSLGHKLHVATRVDAYDSQRAHAREITGQLITAAAVLLQTTSRCHTSHNNTTQLTCAVRRARGCVGPARGAR